MLPTNNFYPFVQKINIKDAGNSQVFQVDLPLGISSCFTSNVTKISKDN